MESNTVLCVFLTSTCSLEDADRFTDHDNNVRSPSGTGDGRGIKGGQEGVLRLKADTEEGK